MGEGRYPNSKGQSLMGLTSGIISSGFFKGSLGRFLKERPEGQEWVLGGHGEIVVASS